MSLIDPTYFQSGNLFIPNNNNLNAEIPGVPNQGNDIQLFIDIHERELLINALGVVLYDDYIANPTDTKWQELINGKTYTVNGNSYRWDGLLGSENQSLIAFYVYCEYLRNGNSVYTTAGVVKPDSANSSNFDPSGKYIYAYNKFLRQYQGFYNDCYGYNQRNNPNVIINCSGKVGLDYYNNGNNESIVNMYQYLTDQNTLDADTFPDFKFKFYKRLNSWGL